LQNRGEIFLNIIASISIANGAVNVCSFSPEQKPIEKLKLKVIFFAEIYSFNADYS
jgi:hypothetical protein